MNSTSAANRLTVVKASPSHRLLIYIAAPTVGAVLGSLTAQILAFAIALEIIDPTVLFGIDLRSPFSIVIAAVIGAIGGMIFAAAMLADALRCHITAEEITLAWDDARLSVPKHLIRQITIAEDIIIFGDRSIELARVRNDLNSTKLRKSLTEAGYDHILASDPYATEFSAATSCTALTTPIRRLLTARTHALANRAHGDAELLRRRLATMGVIVRDIHRPGRRPTRQEWRLLSRIQTPENEPVPDLQHAA